MEVLRFNLRRAEEERQKAAAAVSEETRQGRIQIAEIFERRAAGVGGWLEART